MSFGLVILCIYMTIKRHVSQQRCVPSLPAQNFLKVSKSTSINLPDEPFISTDRHVHVPSMCYLDATIRVLSSTFNKRPPIKPCGKLPRPYIPWSFRRMRYEELGEIGLGPSAVPICRINVHCKWNRYRRNPLSCWLRITMASDQSYPEKKKKAEAGREARESLRKLENRTHRGQRVQRGEAKLLELSMYQAESLIAPKALLAKLLPWNVILPCYPRLPSPSLSFENRVFPKSPFALSRECPRCRYASLALSLRHVSLVALCTWYASSPALSFPFLLGSISGPDVCIHRYVYVASLAPGTSSLWKISSPSVPGYEIRRS